MPGSEFERPKRGYKVRRLHRVVRAVTGKKNRNTTFDRQPDRYFAHVYVNRQLYEGICFLSRVLHLSRMEMARQLLEAGFSKMVGRALSEHMRTREQGLSARSILIQQLVKWGKSKGYRVDGYV